MADPVLLSNLACYLGGYDLTGHLNSVNVSAAKSELGNGRFGDTAEVFYPGLEQVTAELGGMWTADSATTPDQVLWPRIDAAQSPADWPLLVVPPYSPTAAPNTFGNRGYLVVGKQYAYSVSGQHGQLLPFSVTTRPSSSYALFRTTVLAAKATVSVTTTGTGVQLGALTAAQRLVVSFHVFSITGTGQWTLTIQSDDNSGFTSATTRATLTSVDQTGDPTSEVTTVAGAVTDDWWRAVLTEDSGTSSIQYAVSAGVANA